MKLFRFCSLLKKHKLIYPYDNTILYNGPAKTHYEQRTIIVAYSLILFLIEVDKKELTRSHKSIKDAGYTIKNFKLPFDISKIENNIKKNKLKKNISKYPEINKKLKILGAYENETEFNNDIKKF